MIIKDAVVIVIVLAWHIILLTVIYYTGSFTAPCSKPARIQIRNYKNSKLARGENRTQVLPLETEVANVLFFQLLPIVRSMIDDEMHDLVCAFTLLISAFAAIILDCIWKIL